MYNTSKDPKILPKILPLNSEKENMPNNQMSDYELNLVSYSYKGSPKTFDIQKWNKNVTKWEWIYI